MIDFVDLSTVDVQPAVLSVSDIVVVVLLTSVCIFVFIVIVSLVFWVAILVIYCYAELIRKSTFSTDFIDFVELSPVDVPLAVLCVSDIVVVLLLTSVCIFSLFVVVSVVVWVSVLVVYC